MTDRLEEIQILFQKRNARKRGPTSSDQYNDQIEEIAHDFSIISDQWNERLVPVLSKLPNGTTGLSADAVNAFANGLDGKTFFIDADATSSNNSTYYNSSSERPNTLFEQLERIYTKIDTVEDNLENQVGNIDVTAEEVSVADSAGVFDAGNVEDVLKELKDEVDGLGGLSFTSVGSDMIPLADNVYDLGTATLRWKDLFLGGSSLRIITKATDAGTPPAKDYKFNIDNSTGNLQVIDGVTVVTEFSASSGTSFHNDILMDGADIDLNGNNLVLDADGDTKFRLAADDDLRLDVGTESNLAEFRPTDVKLNRQLVVAGSDIHLSNGQSVVWGSGSGAKLKSSTDGQITISDNAEANDVTFNVAAGNLVVDSAILPGGQVGNGVILQQASIKCNDNVLIALGTGADSRLDWSTQQTNHAVVWGLGGNNTLILTSSANTDKNHDHVSQSNPTIFVQSATDPDTDNTQWLSLTHDTFDAIIASNTGGIKFTTAGTNWWTIGNDGYLFNNSGSFGVGVPNGSAANPTFTFSGDTDTGLFNSGDLLGFTTAGTERMSLGTDSLVFSNSTRILNIDGSSASPAYSFDNDTDTGITLNSGDLALVHSGIPAFSAISSNHTIFGASSGTVRIDIANLGHTFRNTIYGSTIDDELRFGFGLSFGNRLVFTTQEWATTPHGQGPGTDVNPTIYLYSNTDPSVDNTQWMSLVHNQTDAVLTSNTGYLAQVSNTGFQWRAPIVGPVNLWTMDNSGNLTQDIGTAQLLNAVGSEASPSYSFNGRTGLGIWSPAGNELAISNAGSESVRVDASGFVGINQVSPATSLHVEDAIYGWGLYQTVDDSSINIGGGTEGTPGGRLELYGPTHATTPNEIAVRASAGMYMQNNPLYLSNQGDSLHGIQKYSGSSFDSIDPDGPVIFGFGGGILGVDTGSQDAVLQWRGGGVSIYGSTRTGSSASGSADNLIIDESGNAGLSILTPSTNSGSIYFGHTTDNASASIVVDHNTGDMIFSNNGASEKMRLKGNGYLGIGSNNPLQKLWVEDSASGSHAARFHNDGNSTLHFGIQILAGLNSPGSTGDIRWISLLSGDGNPTSQIRYINSAPNAEFASLSDARLKKNIEPTKVNALELLNKIPLRSFDWKDPSKPSQEIGYVAQELEQVAPFMVGKDWDKEKEDYEYWVGDASLVKYLVKAVQELKAELDELKSQQGVN